MSSLAGALTHDEDPTDPFRVRLRLKRDRRLASVVDLAARAIAGDGMTAVAGRLGVGPLTAAHATAAALLTLVGHLACTADRGGAAALAGVLPAGIDGRVLDDLPALLVSRAAIRDRPRHPRPHAGERRPVAVTTLASWSGLGPEQAGELLALLAPVVRGVLGRERREQWLDADGLAHLLANQRVQGALVRRWAHGMTDRAADALGADQVQSVAGMLLDVGRTGPTRALAPRRRPRRDAA